MRHEDQETCRQCSFYRDHPELAPKYWTWTRGPRNTWRVICTWPEKEDFPEPGLKITVHRKDSSTSQETVKEFDYHHFDTTANLKVIYFVE